ncbi:MAG: cysteine desulfurase-like protein [Candidatus Obscuribacterales bacterium]|nr:cysteine desulfurase-like protein [Candidatus Obscuribacterales bacterium]
MTSSVPVADLSSVMIQRIRNSRQQFPALLRQVNGRPAVFFDGPGGTQVSRRVIDAVTAYYSNSNANEGGLFVTSQETVVVVEQARSAMAALFNCDADEVVFGANATTITFAISRAIGRTLTAGDEIVVTTLDHDCNVAPWKALEELGVVVQQVDVNPEDCTLDMIDFASKVNDKTKLIAVGFASNAVGTINDVEAVVRLAREVGAMVYVDAVHYAPHALMDVKKLDCDFMVCSPYKFFAPHMGALYGKREHLERLKPYKVRPACINPPNCWEVGTQSFESIAGVLAAVEYLADLSEETEQSSLRSRLVSAMRGIQSYEQILTERMLNGLAKMPEVTLYGIKDVARASSRTPTFGLNVTGLAPETVARHLAENSIFSWNGNFYALSLIEKLNLDSGGGMLRLGCVHYNTIEEVDRVLAVLEASFLMRP